GIRLLLGGNLQKKTVRRCGIGKQKQRGQEACVKASGEDHKTRRPKRLCASSAKEEYPLVRAETPTTASA
ncbi:MAG: RNA-guided endonuclease InsQ/TnpB family protein, partial [Leptospirillia bacterium]